MINKITRSLNIFLKKTNDVISFLYYIFGLDSPEAIIRVRDFLIHTINSLDYTIDLTLKRIYGDKEIETKISRKDMKKLLLLWTKNVHFFFENNIY